MKVGQGRKTPYIKTFSIMDEDQETINKFEEIKWKERVSFSSLIMRAVYEYVEKHGDGNINFTLEQFQDPDFKICPALFRSMDIWGDYINKLSGNELKEIERQIEVIIEKCEFKRKYGNANAIIG